jgi:hypothetical protein
MRTLALGILAGIGLTVGGLPAAADSFTTRIEPRPFYGATVTLEEGVRVFRPLPRHDRVIINPAGSAAVSMTGATTSCATRPSAEAGPKRPRLPGRCPDGSGLAGPPA